MPATHAILTLIGGPADGSTPAWVYPLAHAASRGDGGRSRAAGRRSPLGLTAATAAGTRPGGVLRGDDRGQAAVRAGRLGGPVSGRAWFDNGKTIVFGLVGGYFGVELAKALLGVRVKTGDGFAVPVAAAVAVGRLACFAAGCCYGVATRRCPGASTSATAVRRHPDAALRVGLPRLAAAWSWLCSSAAACSAGSSSSSTSSPIWSTASSPSSSGPSRVLCAGPDRLPVGRARPDPRLPPPLEQRPGSHKHI